MYRSAPALIRLLRILQSTAHALATQGGGQVTMSSLEVAIEACEDFESDSNGAGHFDNMQSYT